MNKGLFLVSSIFVALLSGCGGGGSGSSSTSDDKGTERTTYTAIDGYLGSAGVYVDKNANSVIDSGEYYGLTSSNGQISLPSTALDYPIIVQIVAGQTTDSDIQGVLTVSRELIAGKGITTITPFSTLAYIHGISFIELATLFDFDLSKVEGDYIANSHGDGHVLARSIFKLLESNINTSSLNIEVIQQKSQVIANYINSYPDRDWSGITISIDDNNNVTVDGDGDSSEKPKKSWGSPVVLSTAGDNSSVSIDENGNVMAVWVDKTIPLSLRASYKKFGEANWSMPAQVDAGVGNVKRYSMNYRYYSRVSPDVVTDNGVAFAAWPQEFDGVDSMYVSRWDGVSWASATRLSDAIDSVSDVRVVMDDESNALAVWLSRDADSQTSVYSSFYDTSSGEWITQKMGSGFHRFNHGTVQLVKKSDNSIALAWLEKTAENMCQLNYSEWSNNSWSVPTTITDGCLASFNVDFLSDMSPIIVWQDDSDPTHIKLAKRNNSDWSIERVNTGYARNGYTPDVAVMPNNDDIVVIWSQSGSGGVESSPGYYADTMVKHYSSENGWGDVEQLWDLGSVAPTVHVDDDGRMIAMWFGQHTYISSFTPETGWSRASKVFGYNGGKQHSLEMNRLGNAIATYEHNDSAVIHLYE